MKLAEDLARIARCPLSVPQREDATQQNMGVPVKMRLRLRERRVVLDRLRCPPSALVRQNGLIEEVRVSGSS
jgi:hypothetical protein